MKKLETAKALKVVSFWCCLLLGIRCCIRFCIRSTVILISIFSDLGLNPTRKQGLLNSTKKDGLWLYQSTWVPLKWPAACSAEKMLKQLWTSICPASGMPPNATSIYRNGVVQKRIAPRQSMMKFCTHTELAMPYTGVQFYYQKSDRMSKSCQSGRWIEFWMILCTD